MWKHDRPDRLRVNLGGLFDEEAVRDMDHWDCRGSGIFSFNIRADYGQKTFHRDFVQDQKESVFRFAGSRKTF